MNTRLINLILLMLLLAAATPHPARAQDPTPTPVPVSGPIYIIQPGDSLSAIASRFNVSLDALLAANNITDANTISAGDRLVIPGLEGINGVLFTEVIGYGETLKNISRRNRIPLDFLYKLNRITSPSEMYAGINVIVPLAEDASAYSKRTSIAPEASLLETAVAQQTNPWALAGANQYNETWASIPGDILYVPGQSGGDEQANGLPPAFQTVTVDPLPATQGRTTKIVIESQPGVTLSGMLVDQSLAFHSLGENQWVSLQGIYALLEPGPYPLRLEATLPDGSKQSFEQMIVVQSGFYPDDPILLVEPETIDPATTEVELNEILKFVTVVNPEKYWSGRFQSPAYFNDCFTSRYGNRRTYIGSGTDQRYFGFHTGLDFCGGDGLPITAPAAGKIVFAGPLTIRGNATIIDHGWGIYSGIWHQSQITVQAGDSVTPGQLVGYVGSTGRVTGAHLHWEVWANGIQVNPLEWLETTFP